jgi:aldose 1-epimerase
MGEGSPSEKWPADYEVTLTYEVQGASLKCTFLVRNVDRMSDLPCGFGLHPYFRIPLGSVSSGDGCTITVPAGCVWELDSRLNPTGKRVPVKGREDLRFGSPFSELELDHVYGDLVFLDGACTVTVQDEPGGRTLWMTFSDVFRHCVVFTPPNRKAICIEPYTCIPDPFTLVDKGVDTGLKILSPGESFQGWVEIGIQGRGVNISKKMKRKNSRPEGGR